ncbi:hypothetical protein HY639_05890 [Candidatus Woesearchaeota archaeon]|nr:hypothetical protein [Candidatus Woesearchaeota archaeon]
MKILVITHDTQPYHAHKAKMRWTRFPYLFQQLGHQVTYIYKQDWWHYLWTYWRFKPDVVISVGKVAGLITGFHHLLPGKRHAVFVHDLTDHFALYPSEKRIRFFRRHHDYVTAPTRYNLVTYDGDDLIPNGSDFVPRKEKQEYDACYVGQVVPIYNIPALIDACKKAGISLKIVTDIPNEEVPQYIAKARVCVYPISWDSSIKMYDYAAMAKPVVAIKPNLAELVGYPAYYTSDLASGIKHLIQHPKEAAALGAAAREWFQQTSGTWMEQAKKYCAVLEKYVTQGGA